jgi:pectin methylesterase-like acyl-CoA thioesterase
MTGYNSTQNRKIASRAIISVLVLWLAFSGVAAAEQLYVNESGWWRDSGVFNASTAPIQAAVGAADEGDAIFVWNGSYTENVDVGKRLTLEREGADMPPVYQCVRILPDHAGFVEYQVMRVVWCA